MLRFSRIGKIVDDFIANPLGINPLGRIWCYSCRSFKPHNSFHKDKTKSTGYCSKCKMCTSDYDKKRLRANPEYFKAKNARHRMV